MYDSKFQQRKIETKLSDSFNIGGHCSIDSRVYEAHVNAARSCPCVIKILTQSDSRERRQHACK